MYYKFNKALNGNLIFSQAINQIHPEATGCIFTEQELKNKKLNENFFLVRKNTKSRIGFDKYKTGSACLKKINSL
tara:strand:- start:179 stop:403 length:225 start_codon:yes stop_codon:yes gene_type:complete